MILFIRLVIFTMIYFHFFLIIFWLWLKVSLLLLLLLLFIPYIYFSVALLWCFLSIFINVWHSAPSTSSIQSISQSIPISPIKLHIFFPPVSICFITPSIQYPVFFFLFFWSFSSQHVNQFSSLLPVSLHRRKNNGTISLPSSSNHVSFNSSLVIPSKSFYCGFDLSSFCFNTSFVFPSGACVFLLVSDIQFCLFIYFYFILFFFNAIYIHLLFLFTLIFMSFFLVLFSSQIRFFLFIRGCLGWAT